MAIQGNFGDPPENSPSVSIYRYRFANVEFDESTNTVAVAGQKVAVERLPQTLLSELLRRPNEVVTRAELFETVWEGRPTVDHVLANAVNKLRRALGEEGARRLVNVPRIGYRLTGPIERVAVGRQSMPAVALAAGDPVPGREGYKLRQALGDASHSAVWLAFDAKLKTSRVFKFAVDGERLASLKREYTVYRVLRQELGERTDFARVVGANFSNAPYFLECEYGGIDLPTWAAEHGHLAGMAQPERLALFLQVAHAVAAAHAVGVLHKDLKPSNVLIAADGEGWIARLTDFGSSRLLEPGRLAELGVTAMGMTMTQGTPDGLLGSTPLYVAPELLAGHSPTTGSDLYALGLMLYQLLVGDFRRPMSTGWERDVADPLLRQDLIAATEGRPDHRLGSVAEFAERLATLEQRRAGDALRAEDAQRAAAGAQQLQRARAQRPWAAAVVVSLALGLVTSLWFYSRASAALHRAEQESTRAQAINDFLTADVLQSPDLIRMGDVKPVSMLEVVRRASARAGARFNSQPRTEGSVRYRLAQTFMRLASIGDADKELNKAVALLEPVVPRSDPQLLALRFMLVQTGVRGRDNGADVGRILERAERDAGPEALKAPTELALLGAQARFEWTMSQDLSGDAVRTALNLVELADRVPGVDTATRFEAKQSLAEAYQRVGETSKLQTVLKELASPPYGGQSVGDVVYARTLVTSSWVHYSLGQFDAAEADLIAARDRLTRTLGPADMQVGMTNIELARVYETIGDFRQEIQCLEAALETFVAALGGEHQYVRIARANLAVAEAYRGNAARALKLATDNEAWFAAHATGGRFFGIEFARSTALGDLGRPVEALAALDALDRGPRLKGSDEVAWFAKLQIVRGKNLMRTGHGQEGARLIREAITAFEREGGAYTWEMTRYKQLLDK